MRISLMGTIGNYRSILSCLPLLLFCLLPMQAQQRNTAKEFDVDSTLYAYYQRCRTLMKEHTIHGMADTLFRMAAMRGDVRMQCVAMCTKLDHYYFFHDQPDSLRFHFDAIQEFARQNNQPKYYYFVWSHRIIPYYIAHRQQNTALKEAEELMQEALEEGYPTGIADGHNALYTIYTQKRLFRQAIEQKAKEIEIIRQNGLDSFNLSRKYSILASLYSQTGDLDKAKSALDEAGKYIRTPSQEFILYLRHIEYHLKQNDLKTAGEYLEKAGDMIKHSKDLSRDLVDYYTIAKSVHIARKQYDLALADIDSARTIKGVNPEDDVEAAHTRAKIYSAMGNWAEATKQYQLYTELTDSLNRINEDISSGEFSALLGVEHLKVEKSKLQQEIQHQKLINSRRIIAFLISILAIGFFYLFREYRLNQRLKQSRRELIRKNQLLTTSEKELKIAKEEAEKASEMKTEFIRNMSHEIRTPLNSIVGFAQVISSLHAQDKDTCEYAGIIEQGSNNLLQLMEDVLNLSDLDSGAKISTDDLVEAGNLCTECLEQTRPFLPQGVELSYSAGQAECRFFTSRTRLAQTLNHLLKNAAKFTEQGSIDLAWHTDAEQGLISFAVTDTGIGIPPEKQAFVFERFTKMDTFTQGTGLGLSIGRIVARKLGGDLTLDSTYTGGCRFVLTVKMTK